MADDKLKDYVVQQINFLAGKSHLHLFVPFFSRDHRSVFTHFSHHAATLVHSANRLFILRLVFDTLLPYFVTCTFLCQLSLLLLWPQRNNTNAFKMSCHAETTVTLVSSCVLCLYLLYLRAVCNAAQAIRCGEARLVVAGGQESMSQAPHLMAMRSGQKFGDAKLKDGLLTDGLVDAFSGIHMGVTGGFMAAGWCETCDLMEYPSSLAVSGGLLTFFRISLGSLQIT